MRLFVNNANIHYVDLGEPSSTPVIFLHGFPFSHAMWEAQCSVVSSRYRAIAYDIRGHGLSDVGDGQYTIEGHVDDLMAIVKELGLRRPVIVGLSMGGYIALRALERSRDTFCAAVLCDTRSEADTDEGKLKRFSVIHSVKRIGSEPFAREFVKAVFAPDAPHRVPDAVAKIRGIISHTPPLSIAGTQLALASRTDTTAALPGFDLPVMILVGEHDQTTPPSASRSMHERIHGSTMHIVPHAAHMSNLENPEFFNARLIEFLDGLSRETDRTGRLPVR